MITINGKAFVPAAPMNVGAYLDAHGYSRERIAVEQNGSILPKSVYDTTVLQDGDQIEIVSFVGGG